MSSILVFGLNFKSAPVALREYFVVSEELLPAKLEKLRKLSELVEVVLLSTCNRTEVIAVTTDIEAARKILEGWFLGWGNQDISTLEAFSDDSAISYLLRLAAGVESLVIGEYQILGQLKFAFSEAHRLGTAGPVLNKLYHHVVAAGKRARSETGIGIGTVSVASGAVELASQIFSDLSQHRALVIGAGEMAELALTHFYEHGLRQLTVVNRTIENAQVLAARWQGTAVSMAELENQLASADLVLASTSAAAPLLTKDLIRRAMRRRSGKPLFIIDIAVPRDVASDVAELDDVYLYNVDDLKKIVDEHRDTRLGELHNVERIVSEEAQKFAQWLAGRDALGSIKQLTDESERLRIEFLKSLNGQLSSDEKVKFDVLTKQLLNKLLHGPIMKLKSGAESSTRPGMQ